MTPFEVFGILNLKRKKSAGCDNISMLLLKYLTAEIC